MSSLIYHSKENQPFSQNDVYLLRDKAVKKNKSLSVTGFLQYRNGHFIQYLEGSESNLTLLMNDIKLDHRHEITRQFSLPGPKHRRFEGWYMKHITQEYSYKIGFFEFLEDVMNRMSMDVYGDDYLIDLSTRLVERLSEHHKKHYYLG